MTTINQWARDWNIPPDALADLQNRYMDSVPEVSGNSEAAVQAAERLRQSQMGNRMWRNNVGACQATDGRMIRYGICNESPAVNKKLKSSDLIGITPYRVEAQHIGQVWGLFTSLEIKRPGWRYTGKGRESAQKAWLDLVTGYGGIARFVTADR